MSVTIYGVRESDYDAWFKAKVEEGLEDARQGRFASREEVERRAKARRHWLLLQIAKQK
ncbi:MAG: hypothetical protein HDQ91_05810 [Desulfovibrio sp.]|nr:hypothetical protein [Desulfovibrio sp.]